MNAQEIVQRLSDIKLNSAIRGVLGKMNDISGYSRIVWGAGVSGKNFVQTYSGIGFDYIVDTRSTLQGQEVCGIPVEDPSRLFLEDPERVVVFLPTVIHQELSKKLRQQGFRNIIIPNQFNTSGVGLGVNRSDINAVFKWFHENSIEYVFLKTLPESFAGVKDVDLLINQSALEQLMNCPYLSSEQEDDTVYLDFSLSTPIGLNGELPFYPSGLARHFLSDESTHFANGIRCLKALPLLHAYAYHITIHKGTDGALEKSLPHLQRLADELNLPIDFTLHGLWQFLFSQPHPPPVDLIRKWAAHNNSTFLREVTEFDPQIPATRAVFIFREFFSQHLSLFKEVRKLIEEEGFEEQAMVVLEKAELSRIRDHVRGGIWEDSYQSRRGGGPYALGIYKTGGCSVRKTKERLRAYVEEKSGVEVNAIHSSDDDKEAAEYIELLNKNRFCPAPANT